MLQLIQPILMTYATRRFAWFVMAAGSFLALAMMFDGPKSSQDATPIAQVIIGFPSVLVASLLADMAKWQFVNSRARLLPRFAPSHLGVLAALALVGLGLIPLAIASSARLNTLGTMACAITIAASFIWALHHTQSWAAILGLTAFFSLVSDAGVHFWLNPEHATEFQSYHLGILAAGWIAIAAWLVRLACLHEEMDDYNIPINAQSGSATRMERSQANRAVARHMLRSGWSRASTDRWHDRLIGRRELSTGGRQRLLRFGFSNIPIEVQALWMAAGMFVMFYIMGQASQPRGPSFAYGPLMLFSIFPGVFGAQFLAMRRARMAQELLLPLTRRQYIDGIHWALARVTAVSWLMFTTAAVALMIALQVKLPSPGEIVGNGVALVAVQPYLLGVGVYLARFSSAPKRIGLLMLAVQPAAFAVASCIYLAHRGYLAGAILVAVLMALAGAFMIRHSRTAWLNAELG